MATKKKFEFALGDRVSLTESGETGEIIARGQYINSNPTYLIRYVAGDGRQTEQWWAEDAITGIIAA